MACAGNSAGNILRSTCLSVCPWLRWRPRLRAPPAPARCRRAVHKRRVCIQRTPLSCGGTHRVSALRCRCGIGHRVTAPIPGIPGIAPAGHVRRVPRCQHEGCRQCRRPGDQAEGCPECGRPRSPSCSASLAPARSFRRLRFRYRRSPRRAHVRARSCPEIPSAAPAIGHCQPAAQPVPALGLPASARPCSSRRASGIAWRACHRRAALPAPGRRGHRGIVRRSGGGSPCACASLRAQPARPGCAPVAAGVPAACAARARRARAGSARTAPKREAFRVAEGRRP